MSLPAGSEDVLITEGWHKLVDGPFSDAWHQYWGKDLEITTVSPWKTWDNAVAKQPEINSASGSIRQLAQTVLEDERDITLAPCTFIQTPWLEELPDTKGRIMIAEGYNHLYGCIMDLHVGGDSESIGVIVEGQSGIGKTYLSLYLLILCLSTERIVVYSPHAGFFVFFHAGGVWQSDRLPDWMNGDTREALPDRTWIILDTRAEDNEPMVRATEGHLYPIQLCRPEEKYLHWKQKGNPDILVLELPSPSTVLAGALIQNKMRNRKEDLARLLTSIRDFGPSSRYCYLGATRQLNLYTSLRAYISGLSSANAQRYPSLASWSDYFPRHCLRQDNGPDVFAIQHGYRDVSEKDMLLVIASRHVMNELRQRFSFVDLYKFREMAVIRKPPDDMEQTRFWLFEHLCHSLFSEGGNCASGHVKLSPCFAHETNDELLLEHVFRARPVQLLEADTPPEAQAESYFVVRGLWDTTFHSLSYLVPYTKRRRAAHEPKLDRAITRGQAKRLAAAAQTPTPTPARVTRSRKRVREPSSPGPVQPPAKRPRLKADKRFVVVYQMLLGARPVLSKHGLERLERLKVTDPFAQYFFVFVTSMGQELDLRFISEALMGCFKWYHLQVDLDLYPYRSDRRWKALAG
ncbi:hypothetical protein PENSPDRAFT_691072 [Peniophora sp. CONT]|nr:hypothetical protein PENSPDRAFT_691072 [Peniophora sp. CONT]